MKMLVFSVSDVWVTLFVRKSVVRIQSAMDVRRAVGAAAGASAEADPASRNRAKEVDQGGIVVLSKCFLQVKVAGDTVLYCTRYGNSTRRLVRAQKSLRGNRTILW